MLTNIERNLFYSRQNGVKRLTSRQLRRMRKKLHRNLARVPFTKSYDY